MKQPTEQPQPIPGIGSDPGLPQPPFSLSSIASDIYRECTFFLTSVEGPKHLQDMSHAWANKAHEIPALVYIVNQDQYSTLSVQISEILPVSCPIQKFLDWMGHACENGISSDCMLFNSETDYFQINYLFIPTKILAETNESKDPKLPENENPSYKSDTNFKILPIGTEKSTVINENSLCENYNLTSQRDGLTNTNVSLVQNTIYNTTTNVPSRHSNHKTSVWTFLFLFLLRFTNVAASPRDVPVKKCCPDGQVLDGLASCIPGSAISPFNSILRGLDPSKSNYRDHPVDMSLVSTGKFLPSRPRKLYKLEQGTAWLTVGGKLITSEFEAEFPHGEICVDSTMWGERAAVMKYPCKGNLCLTLCCPHGQALVDDPTIEAAIDENVPKICGNFDWEWQVKFWNKTDNAETIATRNYDFVLREDIEHAGSFSCPSNCGGKKGTLGFADSTYSQVRLYSDGTLSGKLGDTTHLIENKRFCVAYGDPPNYDYGEADTGMRVTYMVCSQPKCSPTEHGLPDAAKDKSASLASLGWFNPLVIAAAVIIVLVVVLVVILLFFVYRKYKSSQDEHGNQPNSGGTNGTMEMSGRSGRGQVNIQTLSGDIDAAEHV